MRAEDEHGEIQHDGPSPPPIVQSPHALGRAQQAAQQWGIQYNFFVGADQARSVAATAPPIVVPQPKIASRALRGRAELLERTGDFIERPGAAAESRVMVLYGLGGVGKTTLALEIAHRAIRNHQVWWIPADEVESMQAALYALAFSLSARDEDFDHGHPSDVLWRYLNSLDRDWLLVIDNADDPAALGSSSGGIQEGTRWLRPPASSRNGIIISSRNGRPERWASWIRMCHVPPLTPRAGAAILADLAPRAGDEQEAVAMSAESPGESASSRHALTTTWEISLDLLERQGHDLARPLLRLLSCGGVSPVPYRALIRPDVLEGTPMFPRPTPSPRPDPSRLCRASTGDGPMTLTFRCRPGILRTVNKLGR